MPTNSDALDGIIAILEAAGQLKRLKRAGWVRVGISHVESVADHSYRLALLALVLGPRLGLDMDRLVRMALLHDLAEVRIGDLTPADGVSPTEKHDREAAAFGEIVAVLPERDDLVALWSEYDEGVTAESRVVHQLDKLEMAIQALEYERTSDLDLSEFWESARMALSEPLIVKIFGRLEAQRSSLQKTEDRG